MGYPLNDSERLQEAKENIVNILKMEGYKLDSGELFLAFKETGGEMEDFSIALEELSEENKIKSDSDGNIMTVEDYDREKSQNVEKVESEPGEDIAEKNNPGKNNSEKDKDEESGEDIAEENNPGKNNAEEDIDSIIKLKEETDNWLMDQLKSKGNNNGDASLKAEVNELKDRVRKLEKIIKNLTKAFE